MRTIILSLFIVISQCCFSQPDTTRWVRAFPITDYIVDLNDSVKLVQVYLPEGPVLKEKQVGLLRGVYNQAHSDTIIIGAGRCNLIKGKYFYFSINVKESGHKPKENDLIYTYVENPQVFHGRILKLASHNIVLQDVYKKEFYDPASIFYQWAEVDEEKLIDSLVSDIHLTGKYFIENNPSMNEKIKGGKYDGQPVLNTMTASAGPDVKDFLDYIIARPRLYAGKPWKISEIFATWLTHGSPMVIRD